MSEIERYVKWLATVERARVRNAEFFAAREAAQMLDVVTKNLLALIAGRKMTYVQEDGEEFAVLERVPSG